MRSRTLTAVVGLLASLAISAALYVVFDTLLVFLFVPFVPVLFRRLGGGESGDRGTVRECPACGFRTADPAFDYCPRDGRQLQETAEARE